MVHTQDLEPIHEASLHLLAEVGVEVLDNESLALLAACGAAVDGSRAHLPEALVCEALRTAPAGFTVAGRRPGRDLRVAPDAPPVLGSAAGPPFVLDGVEQRAGTLDDLKTSIALSQLSSNIDVVGYSVEPTDVPEERRARIAAHAHVTGSDKTSRFSVTTVAELQVALDVNEILFGRNWYERPRLWSTINTTSPLKLSGEACQVLLRLARLGQPICLSSCAMGGTTAPLTLAGILAVQHAELLAGLVLTQLAQPGCPFLYGGTSSVSSMSSGALLMGSPQYWALTEATVQVGHWLGLPVRAGGAVTDSHLPDAQAGIESALSMESVLRLGVEFVHHAVGIVSSFNCFSPAKFVIDDEVLSALLLAKDPIVVDRRRLRSTSSPQLGRAGPFSVSRTQARHARDTQVATLMNRDAYESLAVAGVHSTLPRLPVGASPSLSRATSPPTISTLSCAAAGHLLPGLLGQFPAVAPDAHFVCRSETRSRSWREVATLEDRSASSCRCEAPLDLECGDLLAILSPLRELGGHEAFEHMVAECAAHEVAPLSLGDCLVEVVGSEPRPAAARSAMLIL